MVYQGFAHGSDSPAIIIPDNPNRSITKNRTGTTRDTTHHEQGVIFTQQVPGVPAPRDRFTGRENQGPGDAGKKGNRV